jgi:hypothetical protein
MAENTINGVESTSTETVAVRVDMAKVLTAELQMAEKLVALKYPHLTIVEGSMVQEKDHPTYKNKRRVTVRCECGVLVERATSDLHTFIGCEACKKSVRKLNKAAKKLAEIEAAS